MTIQLIDVVTPDIGLKTVGDKLNNNFSNAAHAASYEVASISGHIPGTAVFSADVYTFTTSGGEFAPLQAGMYVSFKLPAGSANTTTTPDISYNGANYVIKWIDGSALAADDLNETYNKQPILFYFDGTDMLIASDISGSNANGDWVRCPCGETTLGFFKTGQSVTFSASGSIYGAIKTFPVPKPLVSVSSYNASATDSGVWGVGNSASTTVFTIAVFKTTSSATSGTTNISGTIIGRWY